MEIEEKIKKLIKDRIDPALALDGGNVEFVDFQEGVVKVRMGGGCAACPMRQFTLVSLIEKTLTENVPEVEKVENV